MGEKKDSNREPKKGSKTAIAQRLKHIPRSFCTDLSFHPSRSPKACLPGPHFAPSRLRCHSPIHTLLRVAVRRRFLITICIPGTKLWAIQPRNVPYLRVSSIISPLSIVVAVRHIIAITSVISVTKFESGQSRSLSRIVTLFSSASIYIWERAGFSSDGVFSGKIHSFLLDLDSYMGAIEEGLLTSLPLMLSNVRRAPVVASPMHPTAARPVDRLPQTTHTSHIASYLPVHHLPEDRSPRPRPISASAWNESSQDEALRFEMRLQEFERPSDPSALISPRFQYPPSALEPDISADLFGLFNQTKATRAFPFADDIFSDVISCSVPNNGVRQGSH
ncbi:hypothetical protein A0H81_13163 [Grifola frondosa]|uniref:Uncharacterized protein n=1 Tax=Grifola frondosa TaxID=5627 RepID=A0A1C7LQE2_GRIFR|nr:hypothetical protein A0H81_13163 [Grifola frondosa]